MPKADLIIHFESGESIRASSNGMPMEEVKDKYPIGSHIVERTKSGRLVSNWGKIKTIEIIDNKEDYQC